MSHVACPGGCGELSDECVCKHRDPFAGMTISDEPERTYCAVDGCGRYFHAHKWGAIKATGWFQQKDGKAWCPEHVPSWVSEWRAKKRGRA